MVSKEFCETKKCRKVSGLEILDVMCGEKKRGEKQKRVRC